MWLVYKFAKKCWHKGVDPAPERLIFRPVVGSSFYKVGPYNRFNIVLNGVVSYKSYKL